MDAFIDDMEAGRGVVAEKNEVIVLNIGLFSRSSKRSHLAMLPPSNGVEVRRSEGPGSDQTP
jgi:hypothetical protein